MKVSKLIEVDAPDLPERIKVACKLSNKYVRQICAEADISTQYLYGIINGKVTGIRSETLKKIEQALGVDFGIDI